MWTISWPWTTEIEYSRTQTTELRLQDSSVFLRNFLVVLEQQNLDSGSFSDVNYFLALNNRNQDFQNSNNRNRDFQNSNNRNWDFQNSNNRNRDFQNSNNRTDWTDFQNSSHFVKNFLLVLEQQNSRLPELEQQNLDFRTLQSSWRTSFSSSNNEQTSRTLQTSWRTSFSSSNDRT